MGRQLGKEGGLRTRKSCSMKAKSSKRRIWWNFGNGKCGFGCIFWFPLGVSIWRSDGDQDGELFSHSPSRVSVKMLGIGVHYYGRFILGAGQSS
jgi:hypothetical protein